MIKNGITFIRCADPTQCENESCVLHDVCSKHCVSN